MKKIIKFIFLITIIGVLAGFVFFTNYGTRGSGVSKTEVRHVEPFHRIAVEGYGHVNVSTGDTQSVTITTDDNLVQMVESFVRNGELTIRPAKALNPKTDMVFDIVVPKLTHIELAGAASLNLHDVTADALDIELAGACGVEGSGHVDKLTLELAGACRARLKYLESRAANVEVAGTGSAVVFASESIDAEASGIASITCHGNPEQVKQEANGISRVTIPDS